MNDILLTTCLSLMVSDGDIDAREVELLKVRFADRGTDVEQSLQRFMKHVQQDPGGFVRSYFRQLRELELGGEEALLLADFALQMIMADEVVEYREVKFFKCIRAYLKVSDEELLERFGEAIPDFEDFLARDLVDLFAMEMLFTTSISTLTVFDEKLLS